MPGDWGLEGRVKVEDGDFRAKATGELFDIGTLYNNIYYFPVEERVALFERIFRPWKFRIMLQRWCSGTAARVFKEFTTSTATSRKSVRRLSVGPLDCGKLFNRLRRRLKPRLRTSLCCRCGGGQDGDPVDFSSGAVAYERGCAQGPRYI